MTIALYDPVNSPFLTGAAVRLNTNDTARDAYARVAERMLGLSAPAFTDADDVQIATDAVALQVSHMIAAGSEVFYAKSESRGQRAITYRDDATVNPIAAELVSQLNLANNRAVSTGYNPDLWATVTTVRPSSGPGTGYCSALQDIRV